MKSLSSLIIYAASLAPIAAFALYINDAAAAQINSSFEIVIDLLQTLNRSLL